MPSDKYELGNSRMHIMEPSYKNPRKGCWVSVAGAIGIVFLAALVAMAVGLLVFYLHPDRSKGSDVTQPQETTTISVIPTTTAAPSVDYRLSLDLIPTHYIAKLRPYLYDGPKEDFHVNGTVKIIFDVKKRTRELILHKKLMDIDIETISVRHSDETEVALSGAPSYDNKTELYRIPLVGDLVEGETYSVYMAFINPLTDDLKGIYLSEYTDDAGDTKYIATSHTQPTEARKVFPCFDEPALKANFTITLERKAHMTSFCNAGIKTETVLSDGWIADEYATTPPMSTYILAFMVSEFECLNTTTSRGKLVYVCCRPEYLSQAEHAISIAGEMQEFYEEYHDVDYPLPITVHMAVPDFSAGAMENWGLIFYRETALLFDEMSSAAYNKQRVTIVVAHELAHMWFGNLVTPGWWDDIWLNEGFASYMEIMCTNNSFPEWDMDGQLVSDDLQSVLTVDGLVSSHPIYQPVYDTAQINELFDSIAYSKGASIIRMMRFFLGDETFRLGISNYLKERAYQAAHHNDLFTALTQQAERDGLTDVNVTEIMQTWILQLGYPVVHVSYDSGSGDVTVTQKHFLLDSTQAPPESPFGYQWIVPISLVAEGGDFNDPTRGWLRSNHDTISTPLANKKWVIGNARQQFYYRVNYDTLMWQEIITQLTTDHLAIHSNNRAQLIDDSFNLGRSGDLDIEVSLDATRYLVKEQEYVPWRTTWHNLDYMNRMLQTSGNYGYLQKYVQKLIKPTYDRIGWNDDTLTDPHLEQRHRVITLDLACGYGMPECLVRAGEEFNAWMNEPMPNTTNPISNNLRSVTYCSAIRNGGATEWEFAWEMYQSAPSSSERGTLLEALTCTEQVYLLSGLLDRTLRSDGVRRQDFSSVVSNVASNPVGRALAWNFIRQNWDQLIEWFGEIVFTLPRIVDGTTESFSSPWELSELESFRDNTDDLATAVRSFDQAIENTKSNIDWRAKNENKIVEWIKTQI